MSFLGVSVKEIARRFGLTETTVSNLKKQELWQEFEMELIAAYKKQLMSQEAMGTELPVANETAS